MTFVLVQRGSWPGWSPNADIYLEAATAAAYLTAARDYHAATGRTDAGIVEPLGGLRTAAQISEMQWAFDNRGTSQSAALYQKYNMDPNSHARPATSSTHFLGICVDIASTFFLDWLIANGERYGLRRTIPGPPWNDIRHFQFFPGTATAALNVTSLDNSTAPTRKKPMTFNVVKQSTLDASGSNIAGKSLYATLGEATGPIQYTRTAANDPAPLFNSMYGAHTPLSDATWDFFIAAYTPKVTASGGAVVDESGVIAAVNAVTAKLTELEAKLPTKATVELS